MDEENDIVTELPYRLSFRTVTCPPNTSNNPREHDMINMEEPEILDIMRKSTIPPSLSLRAPPANIALGGRREKLIGITNLDASERYMSKLQNDRDRNNEALYKCLDNLPIKIKQMTAANSLTYTDVDLARYKALYKSRQPDFNRSDGIKTHNVYRNCESIDVNAGKYNPIHGSRLPEPSKSEASLRTYDLNRNCRSLGSLPSPKSMRSYSTVQSKFSNKSGVINRLSQKKTARKRYLESIDTKLFGFQYDFDSMENSINIRTYNNKAVPYVPKPGFNGHPKKGKSISKITRRISNEQIVNGDIIPSKYNKVLDSNHQVHFVYSSSGPGAKHKVSLPLPPILSERRSEREGTDFFAINSVKNSNNPSDEQTDVKNTNLAEKYLSGRNRDSPGIGPLVPMHSFISETPMSKASNTNTGTRHISKSDTSSTRSLKSTDSSVEDDQLKVSVSKSVLQSREDIGRNSPHESEFSDSESEKEVGVQPLSERALQKHLGANKLRIPLEADCEITSLTEREDSTMTTKSEKVQEMKILIHYKNSELDVKERSQVSDSFAVPAWNTGTEAKTNNSFVKKEKSNTRKRQKSMVKENTMTKQNSNIQVKIKTEEMDSDVLENTDKNSHSDNSESTMERTDSKYAINNNESSESKSYFKQGREKTDLSDKVEDNDIALDSPKTKDATDKNHNGNNTHKIHDKTKSDSSIQNEDDDSVQFESTVGSTETENSGDKCLEMKEKKIQNGYNDSIKMDSGVDSLETENGLEITHDVDIQDDKNSSSVFLTAAIDEDKPIYSFQTCKPDYQNSDSAIGSENSHRISVTKKSKTNINLGPLNSNNRSNTDFL